MQKQKNACNRTLYHDLHPEHQMALVFEMHRRMTPHTSALSGVAVASFGMNMSSALGGSFFDDFPDLAAILPNRTLLPCSASRAGEVGLECWPAASQRAACGRPPTIRRPKPVS